MSHTRVKTKYAVMGFAGSTDYKTVYCHHNHSADTVTFYDERGQVMRMAFEEWESGMDLWDAINRLWFPFEREWNGELKEGVEYYNTLPKK